MAHKFIKELKVGDGVDQILLVAKKEMRKKASDGSPYVHLELRDKTGTIEGKIWNNATELYAVFQKNDFVRTKAEVTSYKNKPELRISSVTRVDKKKIDLADFIPHTSKDIELLTEQLKELLEPVKEPYLAKLVRSFLTDQEFMNAFQKAPASSSHHQAYVGGLLEHTVNLLRLSRLILSEYPMLDKDLFLTGVFLHDIGKIKEYNVQPQFDRTNVGRLIGHMGIGLTMLEEKIKLLHRFPEELSLKLRHLILSHHGKHEYGAPVLPMTLEAIALHFLDNLEAKMSIRLQRLEEASDSPEDWTELWEGGSRQPLYKGKPKPLEQKDKNI